MIGALRSGGLFFADRRRVRNEDHSLSRLRFGSGDAWYRVCPEVNTLLRPVLTGLASGARCRRGGGGGGYAIAMTSECNPRRRRATMG